MLLPDDPDWNERIEDAETISLATLLATGVQQMQLLAALASRPRATLPVRRQLEP